jgi:hypothetical protein
MLRTMMLTSLAFILQGYAQNTTWETAHWKYTQPSTSTGTGWELKSEGNISDLSVLIQRFAFFEGIAISVRKQLPRGGGCLYYSAVAAAEKSETSLKLRRASWTFNSHCGPEPNPVVYAEPDFLTLKRIIELFSEVKQAQKEFWTKAEPEVQLLFPFSVKK